MDPISTIIIALVTGAATALTPTAEQVVKDAYAKFKGLIRHKYEKVDIAVLEADPSSKARQMVIKEGFEKTGAGPDIELLYSAKYLLDAIQAHASDVVETVGVDLITIKAAMLEIDHIVATGINTPATAVRIKDAEVSGNIKITDVIAESGEDKKKL